jgi:hypothetical protein
MRVQTLRMLVSALLVAGGLTASASACSPSYTAFFDFQRAVVSEQGKRTLDSIRGAVGSERPVLPLQCIRLRLVGHMDAAEAAAAAGSDKLGLERLTSARDVLIAVGIPEGAIEILNMGARQPVVPTAPGIQEPQNRRVEMDRYNYGEGRWRCDPAVKRLDMGMCGWETGSCYWELTDGTICDFHGVGDANPAKYSVDEQGKRLR